RGGGFDRRLVQGRIRHILRRVFNGRLQLRRVYISDLVRPRRLHRLERRRPAVAYLRASAVCHIYRGSARQSQL
ncbi:hypothetical protein AAVH_30701, partial [Aphelenchoides avenae]